jgi:hypothetical protein
MTDPQQYLDARNQAAVLFLQRIQDQIIEMEPHIDEDHVVGLFAYTPRGEMFRIFDVGIRGPETIVFIGIDRTGNQARLITHFQSATLVARAVPLKPEDHPAVRRPIGFNA